MSGDDPYVYPGTYVLKNKAGLADPDALERFERLQTVERHATLSFDIPMNVEGYQAIHHHLFQDVYDWAGQVRTINIAKVGADNIEFMPGPLVGVNMKRVFGELNADTCLRDLDPDTFAYRAAVYLEDYNHIHPFRDGNGRTMRAFLKALGHQAGHEIDLTRFEKDSWIRACILGHRGDHSLMTSCIAEAITGRTREDTKQAALDRAIEKTGSDQKEPDHDTDIERD